MRRRSNIAIYSEITAPRWGIEEMEYLPVKRHPKYVYGTGKNAALIHKIGQVKARWWTYGPGGHYLVRLQSPRLYATCCCGMGFNITNTSSSTCEIPATDAVLCAACHGEGRNFPRNKPHVVALSLAKIKKGCIAKST